MIRYNTSLSIFEGYGTSWQPLAGYRRRSAA